MSPFRDPSRTLHRPAATIAAACLALLPSACGSSPGSHVAQLGSASTQSSSSTTSTGSARSDPLAFSRCMRAHGVPNFPDPDRQGNFPPLNQQALGVSKQTSLAAQQACEHLLSSGGGGGTPQGRSEKLAFGVKVAACLRTHGYPSFPDPTSSGQRLPPGVDSSSPQFQAAENACEKQAQRSLGVP